MVATKRALLDIHQWTCRNRSWYCCINAEISPHWRVGSVCSVCRRIPSKPLHGVGLARPHCCRTSGVVGATPVPISLSLGSHAGGKSRSSYFVNSTPEICLIRSRKNSNAVLFSAISTSSAGCKNSGVEMRARLAASPTGLFTRWVVLG